MYIPIFTQTIEIDNESAIEKLKDQLINIKNPLQEKIKTQVEKVKEYYNKNQVNLLQFNDY